MAKPAEFKQTPCVVSLMCC